MASSDVVVKVTHEIDRQGLNQVIQGLNSISNVSGKTAKSVDSVGVSLKGLITNLTAVAGLTVTAFATKGVYDFGKSATSMALDVESSTLRTQRLLEDNQKAFNNWAETGASAYGLSKQQAIDFGAVYSGLVASFSQDAETTTQKTVDILKTTAIVSSATGRTMEDTMERIRSGMLGNTEAIEDLGIQVGVSTISSTNAFKKYAGDKSWDQLDFNMQQNIRLLAIMEQSQRLYGDSVAQTTKGDISTLNNQLAEMKLNLGQAFLPIVQIVLPILTDFAKKLREVSDVVRIVSSKLFGTSKEVSQNNKVTDSMYKRNDAIKQTGNEMDKTAKKVNKATKSLASFDDVVQLSKPSTSSNTDKGEGKTDNSSKFSVPLNLDSAERDMSKLNEKAERLLNLLKAVNGSTIKKAIGDWYNTFKDKIASLGIDISTIEQMEKDILSIIKSLGDIATGVSESFKTMFVGIIQAMKDIIVSVYNVSLAIGGAIIGGIRLFLEQNKHRIIDSLNSIFESITNIVFQIAEIFKTVGSLIVEFFKLDTTKQAIADFIAILFDLIAKPTELLMTVLGDVLKGISDMFKNSSTEISSFLTALSETFAVVFDFLKNAIQGLFNTILVVYEKSGKPLIKAIFESLTQIGKAMLGVFTTYILPFIQQFVKELKNLYEQHLKKTIENLTEIISYLSKGLIFLLKEVLAPIVTFIIKSFGPQLKNTFTLVKDVVIGLVSTISKTFNNMYDGLKILVKLIGALFKGDFKTVFKLLDDYVQNIVKTWGDLFKGILNLIISIINTLVRGINLTMKIDIPDYKWIPEKYRGKSYEFFKIPEIPKLAKGGLATGRSIVEVAEAGNQEAVLPLTDNVYDKLGQGIQRNMKTSNTEKEVHIHVENLYGDDERGIRRFAKKVKEYIDDDNDNRGYI